MGKPAVKAVLLALAWHSCEQCGTAWPGHSALAADTNLGRSAIAAALATLVQDGWLVIGRFPNGGRGLATEYVVLPSVRELSTAPCGICRTNMKKGPPAGQYYAMPGQNHPAPGPFPVETVRNRPENHPPGGHQQSVTTQQSGSAAPRADENSLSLATSFDHPSDDPSVRSAAEDAVRAVREAVDQFPPPTAPTKATAQG